jgi:photosystem II stability/assembly factor-like uncharacterized protein
VTTQRPATRSAIPGPRRRPETETPRGTRRRSRLASVTVVGLLGVLLSLAFPTVAAAHTPHDHIIDVELSPGFATDRTVYTISRSYLLKSTDAGETWTRLVRGITGRFQLSSIAVSKQDPDVVYLTSRGGGVLKSEDGGNTWIHRSEGLLRPNLLFAEVSPRSDETVFAANPQEEGALWRTDDGGATWAPVGGLAGIRAVAFATDDPEALFAGDQLGRLHVSQDGGQTWETHEIDSERSGGITAVAASSEFAEDRTLYVGTEESGVFRSTDGGRSFARVNPRNVLGEGGVTDPAITDLTIEVDDEGAVNLWASTWNEGPFLSVDDGATWTAVNDGLTKDEMADRLGAPNFTRLAVEPPIASADPMRFLATYDGLFRTESGGTSWEYLDTQVPNNVAGLAVSPAFSEDQTIAIATYLNGAKVSTDAGERWQPINTGLATRFEWTRRPDYVARLTGIAFYPSYADDQHMFAGLRGYFLESVNGGASWTATLPDGILVEGVFPADYFVPAFSPDFTNDRTIILGTDRGKVFRYEGTSDDITKISQVDLEITAMVTSPDFGDDQTILAGTTEGVLISTDGGENWGPSGQIPRSVTSLAISTEFAEDGRAWTGTEFGLYATDDGGESWSLIEAAPFDESDMIEAVVVSPDFGHDRLLLVSVKGRGLFRSTDAGRSFQGIAPELLENHVVFSSFYHPTSEPIVFTPGFAEDRTVFGIAEERVYRSTDGGSTWTELQVPIDTHDVDAAAAPAPLLESARFEGRSGDDRGFDTPIGRLSVRRVAAAVGAGLFCFVVLSFARWRGDLIVERRSLRAVLSLLVLAIGLLALTA